MCISHHTDIQFRNKINGWFSLISFKHAIMDALDFELLVGEGRGGEGALLIATN